MAAAVLPASAADPNWQGFYVGGQVGYASLESSWTDRDYDWFGGTLSNKDEGVAGGLTLGYNFTNGPIVYGIEADFSVGSIGEDLDYDTNAFDEVPDVVIKDDFKSLVTVRARAGVVAGNALLYVTAGFARPEVEHTWTEDGDPTDSWPTFKSNKIGVVAGVGVEHKVSDRMSFKGEYLYLTSPEKESTNQDGYRMNLSEKIGTLRVGLNWHF